MIGTRARRSSRPGARRRRHRHDAARRRRPRAAAQVQADDAEDRGHRRHRARQRAEGGRGDEGGGLRLRREADRARPLLAMLERAIERRDLVGENLLLKQKLRRAVPFGNIIGKSKKMHEVLELVESVAGERRQHPHPGRERHRQGAHRQRHPLQQQAREGAVHQDQLRRDPEGPDRVGAVRLQEGRVHRRADRQGRPVRDGRGRLAAARRDRRDAALPADQAAARAAGARVPADRQRPDRPRATSG